MLSAYLRIFKCISACIFSFLGLQVLCSTDNYLQIKTQLVDLRDNRIIRM